MMVREEVLREIQSWYEDIFTRPDTIKRICNRAYSRGINRDVDFEICLINTKNISRYGSAKEMGGTSYNCGAETIPVASRKTELAWIFRITSGIRLSKPHAAAHRRPTCQAHPTDQRIIEGSTEPKEEYGCHEEKQTQNYRCF